MSKKKYLQSMGIEDAGVPGASHAGESGDFDANENKPSGESAGNPTITENPTSPPASQEAISGVQAGVEPDSGEKTPHRASTAANSTQNTAAVAVNSTLAPTLPAENLSPAATPAAVTFPEGYESARREALRRIADVLLRAERAGVDLAGPEIEGGLIADAQDKINAALMQKKYGRSLRGNQSHKGADGDASQDDLDNALESALTQYECAVLSTFLPESEIAATIDNGAWLAAVREQAAAWPQWARDKARALRNHYSREKGNQQNSLQGSAAGKKNSLPLPRREATLKAMSEVSAAVDAERARAAEKAKEKAERERREREKYGWGMAGAAG